MAERTKKSKLPGWLTFGHKFCALFSLVVLHDKMFPILYWWGLSPQELQEIYDYSAVVTRRSDGWLSFAQLLSILLLVSTVVLIWLLMRRKNACLAALCVTVLLELGMAAALVGGVHAGTTRSIYSFLGMVAVALPYAIAAALAGFGVKRLKNWLAQG